MFWKGELDFPLPEGNCERIWARCRRPVGRSVIVQKDKARVAFETEVRKGIGPRTGRMDERQSFSNPGVPHSCSRHPNGHGSVCLEKSMEMASKESLYCHDLRRNHSNIQPKGRDCSHNHKPSVGGFGRFFLNNGKNLLQRQRHICGSK